MKILEVCILLATAGTVMVFYLEFKYTSQQAICTVADRSSPVQVKIDSFYPCVNLQLLINILHVFPHRAPANI